LGFNIDTGNERPGVARTRLDVSVLWLDALMWGANNEHAPSWPVGHDGK
jgi:hypothetical protein